MIHCSLSYYERCKTVDLKRRSHGYGINILMQPGKLLCVRTKVWHAIPHPIAADAGQDIHQDFSEAVFGHAGRPTRRDSFLVFTGESNENPYSIYSKSSIRQYELPFIDGVL